MLRPKSTISAATPNGLLGLSILCLITAAILGLLTSYEAQNKAAEAGAQVVQLQREKAELQTKVEANQIEIASLQKRIEEAGAATKLSENPSAGSAPEQQQTQIASLQKQIEEAGAATKPSENPSAGSAPEQQPTPLPSLEIKPGTASTPEQPTPVPSLASSLEQSTPPPPPPEIKPEHVEQTTPPPRQLKRQKIAAIAAITTPQIAGSPGGTTSISSSRALATYAPKPDYPSEARTRHITGSGVCVVDVDPGSGHVTEASVAQSTGNPILDDSAVRTFRKWRFKPGTVSRVRIPVEFR